MSNHDGVGYSTQNGDTIEVLRDKVGRPLSKGNLPKQTSMELFKMPNNLRDNLDNGEWRREMPFAAVVTKLHLVCTKQRHSLRGRQITTLTASSGL